MQAATEKEDADGDDVDDDDDDDDDDGGKEVETEMEIDKHRRCNLPGNHEQLIFYQSILFCSIRIFQNLCSVGDIVYTVDSSSNISYFKRPGKIV